MLTDSTGAYFEMSKPQYENIAASQWMSALSVAKGDGISDDAAALGIMFAIARVFLPYVYIPAGSYMVSSTVKIPIGVNVVGSCWAQIVATGSNFQDMNNPLVVVQVGDPDDVGSVQLQDLLITVQGNTAGAVLMEWNAQQISQASTAMWDVHFRVGGALGSDLQVANCPTLTGRINTGCIAASAMLHITEFSTLYMENVWAWTADHDLDSSSEAQVDVYTARGILIESLGPVWMVGTASEHAVMYQYNLVGAENVWMGMIQTESPYYPPVPTSPQPFTTTGQFPGDPSFASCQDTGCKAAWALSLNNSNNIQITGAGLYSWFTDYSQTCVDTQNCQDSLVTTYECGDIYLMNLYTVGATTMLVPDSLTGMPGVSASSNTVENAHPFVAAIAQWEYENPSWNRDASADDISGGQGLCSYLTPSSKADPAQAAQEALERGVSAYLDSFLSGLSDQSSWDVQLWSAAGIGQESCASIVSYCAVSDACSGFAVTAQYWAIQAVVNFQNYFVAFRDVFEEAVLLDSFSIADIATTFSNTNTYSDAALVNNLGAALAIVGTAFGVFLDLPILAVTGIAWVVIGSIMSDVGANMADAAGDTVAGAEIDMDRRAAILFNATLIGLEKAVSDVFKNPENLANWDQSIFSNSSYSNRLVALFDNGRFFYGTEWLDEFTFGPELHGAFQKALINVALIDANYYILKNGHSVADCPSTRTGVVLNDVCFTLEQAGSGPVQEGELGSWTVEMGSDQVEALKGTYGVDLGDLYQSAWACETATNVYENMDAMSTFGSVSDAMDPGSLNVAPCLWTLPVFEVDWSVVDDDNDNYWASPCAIYKKNMTASTQEIAVTYLPDNLNAVFTSDFCRGNTGCANSVNSICS